MRNILLATTAITAGLSPTTASAAEKIAIGVGGYYTAVVAITNEDADTNPVNVVQEGEIHFKGESTLDNGLTVGVQVQLEGFTSSDQIDEHYVYLEGGWGRLVLGAENSAPYLMSYNAPTVIPGHGQNDPTFQHITGVANGSTSHALNSASDANKITVFTPRFAGFQLGASYTPDATGANRNGYQSSYGFPLETEDNEDIIGAAIGYAGTFGDVSLGASAAVEYVAEATRAPAAIRSAPDGDLLDWQLGGEIAWSGLTVGGGYIGRSDGRGWSAVAGASYATGPWSVGADYGYYEDQNDDVFHRLEGGVGYALGPGAQLVAGAFYYNDDDASGQDAITGALTLGLSF